MRILKASVLVLGLPLALAACGSDETVTERTTTTTYPSASTTTVPSTTTTTASPDVVTTEREVSVED
jgi:ABC-type glycerol-3-phosphate transport system substrate-binding protein